MTTPNEELILKLRGQAYTSYRPDQLCDRAADLLQSQAERIAELDSLAASAIVAAADSQKAYMKLLDENFALRAELAAIAATEPSMIYHGRCVIDCGDSGHHDVTMLKMIARETKLYTHPMPAQDVKDAERYRWLREQHWSTDTIAVVLNPKQAVKLGHVCPSDSLLDETIDAAIAKGAK